MAQEQSIEAARTRIQRLVEEIATLSRKEMRSEEYFQQFLARAVQATDARGGAIWLVAQRGAEAKSEFQLVAHVELESSLFHADEQQHAYLTRQLAECAQTRKAVVSPPQPVAPDPGSLEAQLAQMQGKSLDLAGNRTPFPFFHIPLMLKEQIVGVLQMWLQPYVIPANYQEFVTFLTSLCSHVEQHLHSRRLGNLVMENQRLHQVLKFSNDVAGSLDPLEVSRLAANYGRDLIGCERCSVLTLHGDRWDVLAISGQEIVEKKSSMVKAMAAFVGIHAGPGAFKKQDIDAKTGALIIRHELLVLSKKELLARAESYNGANGQHTAGAPADGASAPAPATKRTDEIDLAYFEHSHVISAAIAPMFDADQELIGAFFAESTTEGFFDAPAAGKDASGAQRLTEWLALHTGKSLVAAQDFKSIPFLAVTRRMRDAGRALTGRKRQRVIMRLVIAGIVLFLAAIFPVRNAVDGGCSVTPHVRAAIVPEVPGRIQKVFVKEGMHVKKGDPIAQIDTSRLELERDSAEQDKLRLRAEADRLRGLNNEAEALVVSLQASVSEKREQSLKKDIEAATMRSTIDGVVQTKDLEMHTGEFIQVGSMFAEIAAPENWDLLVEVDEKRIGKLERHMGESSAPLPVEYILYSQSSYKLHGEIKDRQQISAMAYPKEKENVFIVTLPSIQVPEELRDDLRSGLTGRAKVTLGREPLAWWSWKSLATWLRLKFI
jgi:GAF domain-containing protein